MLNDFLKLIRLPLLFTALGDPVAGYCLAGPVPPTVSADLAALLIASAALYAAGMVFNDCADVVRDRTLHPHRPLATGRVPFPAAWGLGTGLCVIALLAAETVNLRAAGTTLLLTLGILLYNGVTKRHWLAGSLTMGALRGGNVLLGLAAALPSGAAVPAPPLLFAGLVFLYGTLLTVLSGLEEPPPRPRAFTGIVVAMAVLAVTTNFTFTVPAREGAWASLALTLLLAGGLLYRALRMPSEFDPGIVSELVKISVLGFIPLAAAAVMGSGHVVPGTLMLLLLLSPSLALLTGFVRLPGMEKAT